MSDLPNSERAAFDAYWTPDKCAEACLRAVDAVLPDGPRTILEPAAGGGAWVRAARAVWGSTPWIKAWDIDASAPGLHLGTANETWDRDYLQSEPGQVDLTLGNPPYAGATLQQWLDKPLTHSGAVVWLLRSTVLGSRKRLAWWKANRPTHTWTLVPRPRWGGPGARSSTDTVDPVLVLWQPELNRGGARIVTRHDWLEWK